MKLVAFLAISGALLGADKNWRRLYEGGRCFELRAAQPAADFPRAALAALFHQPEDARRQLEAVIRTDPKQADEARSLLVNVLLREGRYGAAARVLEDLAASPRLKQSERDGLQGALTLFGAFRSVGDLRLTGPEQIDHAYEWDAEGLWTPARIHGQTVQLYFDTGANLSTISRNLARHLSLRIEAAGATTGGMTNQKVTVDVAVVERLEIGEITVENVPFLVMADENQPFRDWPLERRVIAGLPVQLALGSWAFGSQGKLTIERGPRRAGSGNLCFDGLLPVLEGDHQGKPLLFGFDTGAAGVDLYPPFYRQFRALVEQQGKVRTRKVGGVGGDEMFSVKTLAAVSLVLGGKPADLTEVDVFLRTVGGHKKFDGWAGRGFLRGRPFVIDYRSMELRIGAP